MAITITEPALLRLLQLASAALPVGGYAYSQGLEDAIDSGTLRNVDDCEQWLSQQIRHGLAQLDLPVALRLYSAWHIRDHAAVQDWNDYLLASRETRELRRAETAMGQALARLLEGLDMDSTALDEPAFVTAYTCAAVQWALGERACALALAWSWLENQLAAASRLLPLGQTASQRLLGRLQQQLTVAVDRSMTLEDDAIGAGMPGVALASSHHETQYSRLFRS